MVIDAGFQDDEKELKYDSAMGYWLLLWAFELYYSTGKMVFHQLHDYSTYLHFFLCHGVGIFLNHFLVHTTYIVIIEIEMVMMI